MRREISSDSQAMILKFSMDMSDLHDKAYATEAILRHKSKGYEVCAVSLDGKNYYKSI